jgi:hypothetical protein
MIRKAAESISLQVMKAAPLVRRQWMQWQCVVRRGTARI